VNKFLLLILVVALSNQSIAQDSAAGNSVLLPKLIQTVDGSAITADATTKLHVFCMLGVECPVSRFYAGRIEQLSKEYAPRKVQFIAVYSNLHDSVEDIRQSAKEVGLSISLVHDSDQSLARLLAATRVPEVLVLDDTKSIRYRGRIDDQYSPGVKRTNTSQNDLENALDALLSGQAPKVASTTPVGCLITFAKAPDESSSITFCKSIVPLFNEHCVECHRPGEIGPFDISDYQEVRGWADMILETIEQKRMPPWHADPNFGTFKNERHFPESAMTTIRQWVKAGAPYGSAAELPPAPQYTQGWRLPKEPDLVIAMRDKPYAIPASGTVDYQYFVVDPQIKEDRWVSAAQVIPGNPSVVHHAIIFVRPPDGVEFDGLGWLTAFVPGQRATTFPPGFARKIPAGSKFVFQMHYTPNGQEEHDLTQVGLTYIDASEVTHQVLTLVGIDQEFEIPPGADNHPISASVRNLPKSGQLLAVMPHMHLRGKSFELSATATADAGDGPPLTNTLLKVPNYDFNWQHTYEFAEPLDLSRVQRLDFTVTFDNSTSNPFNPNPNEYVVWGDQTWEEMAVTFLEVARPIGRMEGKPDSKLAKTPSANEPEEAIEPTTDEAAYADQFIAKFDKNKDEMVSRDEASRIVRDYAFPQLDRNRDGRVTRDELVRAARMDRGR
jgi:AhpC/TSA family